MSLECALLFMFKDVVNPKIFLKDRRVVALACYTQKNGFLIVFADVTCASSFEELVLKIFCT